MIHGPFVDLGFASKPLLNVLFSLVSFSIFFWSFQNYTLLHVCVIINGVPCCTSPVSFLRECFSTSENECE